MDAKDFKERIEEIKRKLDKYRDLYSGQMLFRSFEAGKKTLERIIWEIDLFKYSNERVIRKLETIAKEKIPHLDQLLKKEEALENAWKEKFEGMSDDLIKAISSVLSEGVLGEELGLEAEEVLDFT